MSLVTGASWWTFSLGAWARFVTDPRQRDEYKLCALVFRKQYISDDFAQKCICTGRAAEPTLEEGLPPGPVLRTYKKRFGIGTVMKATSIPTLSTVFASCGSRLFWSASMAAEIMGAIADCNTAMVSTMPP